MAICPNCGAQVPDGAQFCGECGAPLAASIPQQQQAPYQQQAPAQPMYGGGYRQAAHQSYGAPQRAPGAFGEKVKGFWNKLTSPPAGQVDFSLLRIISLVLAVGFVLFSLGLCSRIYYNRNIGEMIEFAEELKGSTLKNKEINQVKDALYAEFRLDPKGYLKASGYTSSQIKEYTKDQLESVKENMKESVDAGFEEYGFRYTMLQFGTVWGSLFLWIGLVITLGAAVFWWIKGGRPYNYKDATIMPALIAACAIFLILFIVNLSVATCVEL